MRAISFSRYGGTEVLEMTEIPVPEPEAGELLIAVRAAALNPADGKWRLGMFQSFAPLPFPHVLGYDVAGTVEKGDGFAPGTRVAAMLDTLTKGGYAEYAKVKASSIAAIPDDMAFATAAAIPTAGLTGLQMVETAVDAQRGQRILITGALGAVGHVAVHIARARGAHVVAGVRANQADAARTLGAAEVAVIGEDWTGAPFDHVIDTVGGPQVARLCRHLKAGGRIVTAATTPIDPTGLAATPEFYGVTPDGRGLARLVDAVASGALTMPVARTLPLERAAKAQAAVDAGGTGGKIVLLI